MGTMRYVAVDGAVRYIFCKMDGNPEHMLPVLGSRFSTQDRSAVLVSDDAWCFKIS